MAYRLVPNVAVVAVKPPSLALAKITIFVKLASPHDKTMGILLNEYCDKDIVESASLHIADIIPHDCSAMDEFSDNHSIINHFEEIFEACGRYQVTRLNQPLQRTCVRFFCCDNC